MLFLFTIIIDFVVIKITRISPFQKGFEMGYISLHWYAGAFRYWYFMRVILRLVSQRRSKIHGGIIHGKKQIGRVWVDAISRRFFEAAASYVAKNLG